LRAGDREVEQVRYRREIDVVVDDKMAAARIDAGRAGSVDMTNASADGRIAVDAVRFVWRGD